MNLLLDYGVELAILELIVILLLIVCIVVVGIIFLYRAVNEKNITNRLEILILKMIAKQDNFTMKQIPKYLQNTKCLLQLIFLFDKNNKKQEWLVVRHALLQEVMLPLARQEFKHGNVREKLYASAVFILLSEPQDEALLDTAEYATEPLTYLNTCIAGMRFGFKSRVLSLIQLLATTSWLYQNSFTYIFRDASKDVHLMVKDLLQTSNSSKIRAVCYDILMQFPPEMIHLNMEDFSSKDLNLKMSALKFIAHANRDAAIPILINQLQSDNIDVKLVSIHRLYRLKAAEAQHALIQCLSDADIAVQLSAAKAIIAINPANRQLIHSVAPDLNLDLAELPYVANMDW